MPVKETEQQIQQTSSTSSQLQSYLFMGLIGFSIIAIIIVLFVTFIFLKKRRREGPLKSAVLPERVARRMDDLLDEESIVTLDSKIQDELDKYGR
jgi:predicted PurR-regulated permease PerM